MITIEQLVFDYVDKGLTINQAESAVCQRIILQNKR